MGIGFVSSERAASLAYYMLPFRAWEMLLGSLVFFAGERFSVADSTRRIASYLAILALVVSFFVFSETTPWPSFYALLPTLATAAIIFCKPDLLVLSNPVSQYLGKISYSLYLWHWPTILALHFAGYDKTVPVVIIGIVISLVVSHLSYVLVEIPAQRILRKPPQPVLKFVFPVSVCVLAAVLGVLAAAGGVPSRVKGDRLAFADAVAASNDRTYPDECRFNGGNLVLCSLGNPAEGKNVLVIGDSFAEQWWPYAFQMQEKLAHHAVFFTTATGCPPLPLAERPNRRCGKHYELAMEQARNGRFSAVVVIGDWAAYVPRTDADLFFSTVAGQRQPLTPGSLQNAIDGLQRDLNSLSARGVNVAVVTTTPFPGKDVAAELRSRLFAGEPVGDRQDFDWHVVRDHYLPIDEMLLKLNDGSLTVLDPQQFMCEDGRCPSVANGRSLYTDPAHIRPGYAISSGVFLDRFMLGGT